MDCVRRLHRQVLSLASQPAANKKIHIATNLNKSTQETLERPEQRVTCTLIPGDGVGPKLFESVQQVFNAAKVPVDFESYVLSEQHRERSASLEDVVASIVKNGVCLKGVIRNPAYSQTGDLQTVNMKLRNALDLYANVVRATTMPGLKTRHKNIDVTIIREQTEGEYSHLEHESVKGVVEALKIVTKRKSLRIAKFAFDYAIRNNRKKVTAVHKANIMKLGDGLFLKCCEKISKLYPKIKFQTMIVDNCTMQMVSRPQQFDVMVTPNLYGNIIDNLVAGLVGGAGVVAGASFSANCVVFEPGAKHTFSKAKGKNIANPSAMLLCSAKMLEYVNLNVYGEMIKNAIFKVFRDGKVRTQDIGGQATTKDFTSAVINSLVHPKK